MTLILLAHVFATLFLVGLIWFVQIVHYPLFSIVGKDQFSTYEERHQRRTTWVVAPAMLVELITAIMLLKQLPDNSQSLAWGGVSLIAVIWLSTGLLSMPAHRSLTVEYSTGAYQKLVWTNWIRTVAWSIRGLLILMMVYRCIR